MKTARELKDEYKKMKFRMGVFRIRNIKNDKCFIGTARTWMQHGTHNVSA
jgi:hypothetical protein